MGFYGAIFGDGGVPQVDSTKANLPFLCSGSFSNLTQVNSHFAQTVSSPNGEIVAACAFRPSSDCYAMVEYGYDANGKRTKVTARSKGTTAFPYLIYSMDAHSTPSGYGLTVFDENGSVVFNSGNRYLKIREVKTVATSQSALDSPTKYVDVTHSETSAYYILPLGRFWYPTQFGGQWGGILFYLALKKLSATSVRVGWQSIHQTGPVSGDPIPGRIELPLPLRLAVCAF